MYRWKRLNKAILKMPKVAEDEIIISTDGKGNRRVFLVPLMSKNILVKTYYGSSSTRMKIERLSGLNQWLKERKMHTDYILLEYPCLESKTNSVFKTEDTRDFGILKKKCGSLRKVNNFIFAMKSNFIYNHVICLKCLLETHTLLRTD